MHLILFYSSSHFITNEIAPCCIHKHAEAVEAFRKWRDISQKGHFCIQLLQLRLFLSKAEKSNTSAKGLLGIVKKFVNF